MKYQIFVHLNQITFPTAKVEFVTVKYLFLTMYGLWINISKLFF